ncbi:hypothetical protein [Psychromonas sp. MME1]|uniref:hypothetical protein n=1 Tax=Psychromonas sp. MME1 TaxID=3231032 RepID=UPI0034E2A415
MESLDENSNLIAQRKSLLPWWVKCVGWLFVVMGALSIPLALFTLLPGSEVNIETFGIVYQGNGISIELILIVLINLFLGVTALGLLRGKTWGLNACIANGFVGIAICLIVMFLSISNDLLKIRLEPIFQVIFLVKLYRIKPDWFSVNEKLNKANQSDA